LSAGKNTRLQLRGKLRTVALITVMGALVSGCGLHNVSKFNGFLLKQERKIKQTVSQPPQRNKKQLAVAVAPTAQTINRASTAQVVKSGTKLTKTQSSKRAGGRNWVVKTGKINRTFSQSARSAGIPSGQVQRLESLFAEQVNFRRDLRRGDRFTAIIQPGKDGTLERGTVLAAELERRGSPVKLIRHTDRRGVTRFYSGRGEPVGTDFSRTPLKNAKVSSHFTLSRYHPVLKTYRPHRGTDFKAKTGTRVMATADGVVEIREQQSGYGNVIFLAHQGGKYTTVYAHLSRFARGLKPGTPVQQGQVIGYVGSTGLSTGPHLHYEFREDGEYRDAMKVALPQKRKVTTDERKHFYQSTIALRRALLTRQNQQLAWAK